MDLQLDGRRAIVTGGNRGIGKAVARQLALEGAEVVIAARDVRALDATTAELTVETGGRLVPLRVDTGDDDSVAAMVASAVEALGGVDILVNSAAVVSGQAPPARLHELTSAMFWDDVNVKTVGYLRCAREVAPFMAERGWGRIVNISGLAARRTGSIVGSIRNVAVAALTANLAAELGPSGINVTCVHPGFTITERTASMPEEAKARMAASNTLGRLIDASEVANLVAFLASPLSSAVTGDAIACGGGSGGAIHY